jgi:hypothetical protein
MPDKFEENLKAFAKQATSLAEQIRQDGSTPGARGHKGGFQVQVNVDIASSPHVLVKELQDIAKSIGLYLKGRRVGRGQPPEG